jgi:hypothetical protein
MTSIVTTKTQSNARHWTVAAGGFIVMIGASIVLSGLLLITAPIISDLYYQKDAAGKVLLRTLPSGAKVPVEINGGQLARGRERARVRRAAPGLARRCGRSGCRRCCTARIPTSVCSREVRTRFGVQGRRRAAGGVRIVGTGSIIHSADHPAGHAPIVFIFLRSTPIVTSVSAIFGDTPVMMTLAPIRRDASTVRTRWLATACRHPVS